MSFAALKDAMLAQIIADTALTGAAVRVGGCLLIHLNTSRVEAWPAIKTITHATGLKPRSVTRGLTELVAKGHFRVVGQRTGGIREINNIGDQRKGISTRYAPVLLNTDEPGRVSKTNPDEPRPIPRRATPHTPTSHSTYPDGAVTQQDDRQDDRLDDRQDESEIGISDARKAPRKFTPTLDQYIDALAKAPEAQATLAALIQQAAPSLGGLANTELIVARVWKATSECDAEETVDAVRQTFEAGGGLNGKRRIWRERVEHLLYSHKVSTAEYRQLVHDALPTGSQARFLEIFDGVPKRMSRRNACDVVERAVRNCGGNMENFFGWLEPLDPEFRKSKRGVA